MPWQRSAIDEIVTRTGSTLREEALINGFQVMVCNLIRASSRRLLQSLTRSLSQALLGNEDPFTRALTAWQGLTIAFDVQAKKRFLVRVRL